MTGNGRLRRELGMPGAVVTGLGSILGTGAFVSIGLASGMWGDVLLAAIPLAGCVAVFNGLSSAFLAGRFPVAGGTYEYAYQTLGGWWGFGAGWLFLLAKTASAASAALGIALYLGVEGWLIPVLSVTAVTLMVISGVRRTAALNAVLVSVTVAAIVWFGITGLDGAAVFNLRGSASPRFNDFLAAIAFLFVAYTGYGRIATLGEEVKEPARVIPRAVIITLVIAAALYLVIELGGRGHAGPFWGAVLSIGLMDSPVIAAGAITAMAGVLLNLILGLSRVWLAMGRRHDMPPSLARVNERSQPVVAIVLSGALVALVTLLGDIGLAWAFSAMTVLLYYGVTNLAALAVDRRRLTAWAGLGSCAFLSFFVQSPVWLAGAGLVALGFLWKALYSRRG